MPHAATPPSAAPATATGGRPGRLPAPAASASSGPPPASDDDRRYARAVLPRVSRTFAVNIRLLAGPFADAVRTGYLLCRSADALEDSWPGPPSEVAARFDLLLGALDGDDGAAERLAAAAAAQRDAAAAAGERAAAREELDLVAHLPRVVRVYRALADGDRAGVGECVRTMARGMSRYAARAAARGTGAAYLDDEGELHDYCWVVAGCVGVMLTRLAAPRLRGLEARDEARLYELAPVVGEALQLTNILLDWPVDARRGRCHVPAAWLDAAGLEPGGLVGGGRPAARALAARLEDLARAALARVPEYLDRVPRGAARYRAFVLWPALWALRSLEHARRDPEFPWGPRRPRLPRAALWRAALGSLVARDPAAPLRRAAAARPAVGAAD